MNGKELNPKTTKQRGLYELLRAARIHGQPEVILLPAHPFGLSIPESFEKNWNWRPIEIKYFGYPGYTERSVNGLLVGIIEMITSCPISEEDIYLRFFDTEVSPGHHDIYCEAGIAGTIFMCGGCTDYSGEGKAGTERMMQVFALLSHLYTGEVQETSIPYQTAQLGLDYIRKAIAAAAANI